MNLKLKKKLKIIPKTPGIYFWLDKSGKVLYVGRATNLHNRLSQYFQKDISPRILEMVEAASNLKFEITENLLEAVILEAKNIKKYWPKYNIVDRDDRSFIYAVIPKIPYSKILLVRGSDLKKFPPTKARIFGPYQSFYLLQNALKIIRRLFPYGLCQPGSGKACFDYQIGLCPGACIGSISIKDYQKNIDNIILLLSGEKKRLINRLMKENPDTVKALRHLHDVSLLSREDNLSELKVNRIEGYDISHLQGKEAYGSMVVFENNLAIKEEYRLFKIKSAPEGDDERALAEVLLRRFKHDEWTKPTLIMIDGGTPQISYLSKILKAENINTPLIGISKFSGDKLIFQAGIKKPFKDLAQNIKPVLLKIREEAHRFANRGRKRGLALKIKNRQVN